MPEFIQVLIVAFAAFAVSRIFGQFRTGKITLKQFIFWCLPWVGLVTVVVSPHTFGFISDILGVGRLADALVYVAIVILLYMQYRSSMQLEQMRIEITRLTREIAIREKTKK